MSFPSQADELALHERVLRSDPVAPVDVFQTYVSLLLNALGGGETHGSDDAHDSVIDAVLFYLRQPEQYDWRWGRLFNYLMQATRKQPLAEQGFVNLVGLQAPSLKEQLERGMEVALVLKRLERYDLREKDQAALRLILWGEGSIRRLAEVLGLKSLPEEEMRREVTRHRDRLMKLLERLGQEVPEGDS